MCLRIVTLTWQLRLGLALLAITSIVNYVIRRANGGMDFITGLLFGLSFGMLMLAMWRNRHDQPGRGTQTVASRRRLEPPAGRV